MSDFDTDKATYSPEDFQLWNKEGVLEISPKFQRRSVWRTPARSFFIDTILRGMTVPPIYLRKTQSPTKSKMVREVVDGQQRIRCILEFLEDGFKLSKNLKGIWAGKSFGALPSELQKIIKDVGFSCETYKGISDAQVLEVFSRLNSHGVPLNDQELRNGRFFGLFKTLSFTLAHSFLEFWRNHRIYTETSIARMLEVELTSELLVASNAGMQDKKKSLDGFYSEWDESYPNEVRDEKRFRDTMSAISEVFGSDSLKETEFRRPPMFYTLYCVVYHHLFGLPGVTRHSPKSKLNSDDRASLKDAVNSLSEILSQTKDPAFSIPAKYQAFVQASSRQTDNIKPRTARFNTLFETAF
jgi:hypothetical protein